MLCSPLVRTCSLTYKVLQLLYRLTLQRLFCLTHLHTSSISVVQILPLLPITKDPNILFSPSLSQSINDTELKLLGRNHTACEGLSTLEEAKKLFPGRTSVDLIFGLPGQTVDSWMQGLEKLLPFCDDHISLYQLTLERGTSLFKQVHQGFLPVPDLDVVAEMYESARQVLHNAGFHQYEISNFARNVSLFICLCRGTR